MIKAAERKTLIRVLAVYLGSVLLIRMGTELLPVVLKTAGIRLESYMIRTAWSFLVLGIAITIFWILKKKDQRIKDAGDVILEGNVHPYTLAVPKKTYECCYQPMTFFGFLGIMGVLCLLRQLTLDTSWDGTGSMRDASTSMRNWYPVWICIVCPIVDGMLNRALLQRNLMRYGKVYAIVFAAVACLLSKWSVATEQGYILFLLFYGFLATRYGISWSMIAEMMHMFFYTIPLLLDIRITFPGAVEITTKGIFDRISFYIAFLFLLVLAIRLIIYLMKRGFGKIRYRLPYFKASVIRADGTLTALFFGSMYLMERIFNRVLLQAYYLL